VLHATAAPKPAPADFWIFRFKRGKMLEHWDKGLFFDRAAAAKTASECGEVPKSGSKSCH
jgi:hypothetical protein